MMNVQRYSAHIGSTPIDLKDGINHSSFKQICFRFFVDIPYEQVKEQEDLSNLPVDPIPWGTDDIWQLEIWEKIDEEKTRKEKFYIPHNRILELYDVEGVDNIWVKGTGYVDVTYIPKTTS